MHIYYVIMDRGRLSPKDNTITDGGVAPQCSFAKPTRNTYRVSQKKLALAPKNAIIGHYETQLPSNRLVKAAIGLNIACLMEPFTPPEIVASGQFFWLAIFWPKKAIWGPQIPYLTKSTPCHPQMAANGLNMTAHMHGGMLGPFTPQKLSPGGARKAKNVYC